jgi:hypothetical protein
MTLLERLKQAVANERSAITAVLQLLIEADEVKLHTKMAYPNQMYFCMKELGYSEGAAWRRVNAARLLRKNSQVSDKLENGSLTLSNAVQIQSAIKTARHHKIGLPAHQLIEAVSGLSAREAEKKISATAREYGLQQKEEDSLDEKFGALRAYFSHRHPNPTQHELLHLMADEILCRRGAGNINAPVKSPHALPQCGSHYPRSPRRPHQARESPCALPLS